MNNMVWDPVRIAPLPAIGGRALCPLLMAGDPDIEGTRVLLEMFVEMGVPVVELCVPFPNAFTDGPVLQRAHARGLANGCDFDAVLEVVSEFCSRIAIVVLADSSHTLNPLGYDAACARLSLAGAAAILPHGLTPRMWGPFHKSVHANRLDTVGTVYANSKPEVRARVFDQATGYIYVVSAFGKSGGSTPDVTSELHQFRQETRLPLALGFGLKTGENVRGAFEMGANIAIVGSAVAGAVEADGEAADRHFPRTRDLLCDLVEGTRT